MTAKRVDVDGPYFEDFTVGQVFDDAPSVTITSGIRRTPPSVLR